jgi:hypothetical protein
MLMARDPQRPVADQRTAANLPAAPSIEVLVLDVPRRAIGDVQHELATLATLPSIELVDATRITGELGSRATSVPRAAQDDDLDSHEDAYAGAFFGADMDRASSVRDEILEVAARLPASRAAVVVMYRNRWRTRLDGLFRSSGVQVLVERTVTPVDAMSLSTERTDVADESAVGEP